MYGTAYSKICPLVWPDSAIDVNCRLVAKHGIHGIAPMYCMLANDCHKGMYPVISLRVCLPGTQDRNGFIKRCFLITAVRVEVTAQPDDCILYSGKSELLCK